VAQLILTRSSEYQYKTHVINTKLTFFIRTSENNTIYVILNNNPYHNSQDHMKNNIQHPHIVTLGLAIEAERKRRLLTQTQLAELSNTSINFVSQIERGKKTAQIGKVIDILQILGLQLVIEKGSAGVVNQNE